MLSALDLGRRIEAVAYLRRQSDEAGFKTVSQPSFKYLSGYVEFWLRFIGVRSVVSLSVQCTWDGHAVDMIEAGRDKRRRWRGNFGCCHAQFRGSSINDIRPARIIPTQNPLTALPGAAGSPGGR